MSRSDPLPSADVDYWTVVFVVLCDSRIAAIRLDLEAKKKPLISDVLYVVLPGVAMDQIALIAEIEELGNDRQIQTVDQQKVLPRIHVNFYHPTIRQPTVVDRSLTGPKRWMRK